MIKKLLAFLICVIIICPSGYADSIAPDAFEGIIIYVDDFNMFEKPKLSAPATRSGAKGGPVSDIEGAKAAMKAAMLEHKEILDCSQYYISVGTAINIFRSLWYEAPELFYVNFYTSSFSVDPNKDWQYYESGNNLTAQAMQFGIPYRFNKESAEGKKALIQKECNNILKEISPGMGDVEKVLAVHDYFALNYEYNYSAVGSNYITNPEAYSMDGIFIKKTAVCQGIALGFMYVLGLLGIDSVYVPSLDMVHAWNLVNINKNWYHVDVTWDLYYNQYAGWCCHDYILLSDTAIGQARPHYQYTHYGWEADYMALDTTYDSYFWISVTSGIFYNDGYWYYVSINSDTYADDICRRNIATGEESVVIKPGGYWIYGETEERYLFVPNSRKMFLHNSRIYYTTTKSIRSADLDGKNSVKEVTLDTDEQYTYVCGLVKDGGNARYCVMKMSQSGNSVKYELVYEDTFDLPSLVKVSRNKSNYVISLDKSITDGMMFAAVYNDDKSICIPVKVQEIDEGPTYSFPASKAEYTNLKVMIFDDNLKPLMESCAEFDLSEIN